MISIISKQKQRTCGFGCMSNTLTTIPGLKVHPRDYYVALGTGAAHPLPNFNWCGRTRCTRSNGGPDLLDNIWGIKEGQKSGKLHAIPIASLFTKHFNVQFQNKTHIWKASFFHELIACAFFQSILCRTTMIRRFTFERLLFSWTDVICNLKLTLWEKTTNLTCEWLVYFWTPGVDKTFVLCQVPKHLSQVSRSKGLIFYEQIQCFCLSCTIWNLCSQRNHIEKHLALNRKFFSQITHSKILFLWNETHCS